MPSTSLGYGAAVVFAITGNDGADIATSASASRSALSVETRPRSARCAAVRGSRTPAGASGPITRDPTTTVIMLAASIPTAIS